MSQPDYVHELQELNQQIQTQHPADVLQFCANHFNRRLEEQRSAVLKKGRNSETRGSIAFRSPFGGNDPFTKEEEHTTPQEEGPRAPASSVVAEAQPPRFHSPFYPTSQPSAPNPGSGFAAAIAKLPMQFNAHRRTSVSAEPMNPNSLINDSWKPPHYDFSPEQLARLNASVGKSFLFSQLDEEAKNTIIHALTEKKVSAGTEIIRQGDEGDFFYVIESGKVDFLVNEKKVNESGPGASFGELALMYNSQRAATALAASDCILWALDRTTFRRILLEGTAKRRNMYEDFLKDVSVLSSLSSYERNKLADALNTEQYAPGDIIVKEGDVGENFYFIESGTAQVIKEGTGVVAELGKGDYFGEVALLNDLPRQATVKATAIVKVVTLGKSGFQRLLGPAVEILKRQDPTK